jgi:superfamily I DNA/RNA helicase
MTDEELIASLDEKVSHTFTEALIMLLNRSAFRAMEGTIDFGDQILFPSLFKCRYPIFTLILVDEAQDLSPLNHEMLDQLYRRRMIAVGDSNQAIYAFRGAFEDGMDQLISRFDMKEFSLSTTFRCPEMIVKHVHWKTPHMRWFPSNTEGAIEHKAGWTTDDLPRECAILCRNNAPLFSLAIKLLRQHRYAKLWANDIAAGLLKTMKDLGGRSSLQETALAALVEWRDKKLKKAKKKGPVLDQYECIKMFLEENRTLGEAMDYAQNLFTNTGTINLLTCHKSKGHEFNEVFILDEFLMSDEGQDPNLRYVACTRTKRNLTYLETSNFIQGEE